MTGLSWEEPFPPGAAAFVPLFGRWARDDKGDFSFASVSKLAARLLFDVGIRRDVVADTLEVDFSVFKLCEMQFRRGTIIAELLVANPAGGGGVHKIPGNCQAHDDRESGAGTLKRSHTLRSNATRSLPKIQGIQVAGVIEPVDGDTAIPDRDDRD